MKTGSYPRVSEFSLCVCEFSFPLERLCRNRRNYADVMLSKAKHLAFSSGYEVEILRLRLRMTLRDSL